jgi:hypothetical protein
VSPLERDMAELAMASFFEREPNLTPAPLDPDEPDATRLLGFLILHVEAVHGCDHVSDSIRTLAATPAPLDERKMTYEEWSAAESARWEERMRNGQPVHVHDGEWCAECVKHGAATPAPLDHLIALLEADAADKEREMLWRYGVKHALTLIRHHLGDDK